MPDIAIDQLLKIDEKSYRQYFRDPDFGIGLATQVARSSDLVEKPVRVTEGSSLVFSVGSRFLKLTPPFFGDSLAAEINATKLIGNQLPFHIPLIVADGAVQDWKFVITEAVPGVAAKDVMKKMTPATVIEFAKDIGQIIKAIRTLSIAGFERDFGTWDKYLASQLKNQKSIHLARGNSEAWADSISNYVNLHKGLLENLGEAKLIHADLNHEHLMMDERDGRWRIVGVLDFADAMNAPVEMELVLPILCFFKGNVLAQRELVRASGAEFALLSSNYSELMMTLTLQNRFIALHDWFAREIRQGATSIEEIAGAVFPAI